MTGRGITCSRCGQPVDSAPPCPSRPFTAGYYVAAAWADFANPGEEYICDACMFADPRYIAVYGQHPGPSHE